jgi:hypothetical protein
MLRCAFPKNPTLKEIVFIKAGRFNTIYKVCAVDMKPVIFRIAPKVDMEIYEHEKFLLRREYTVQPFLSHIAELIPRVLFADFTGKIINRDYVILSYIDGVSGDNISVSDLSKKDELFVWEQLSEISLQISKSKNNLFGFPQPSPIYLKWSQAIYQILIGMIHDLDRFSLSSYYPKKLVGLIPRYSYILDLVKTPRLVHGDLWPKNTILSKNSFKIKGMLDSERAFWGDPKAEWIIPGAVFAGQSTKKGYLFRCGFFSEHFTQIPNAIAKKFQPTNHFEIIRNQIYLGIYLTQRILESQRFPRKEPWIDDEFQKVVGYLTCTN